MRMPVARPRDAHFPEDGQLDRAFADVYSHLGGLTAEDVQAMIDAALEGLSFTDTGTTLVDRGDPASHDWQMGDLTADNAWHDLDLSSIVPAGATHVLLRVEADKATREIVAFRQNGNVNEYNVSKLRFLLDSRTKTGDCIVAVDGNRIIEYKISATLNYLNITVGGWWI